jgi:hypothetical protein
MNLLESKMIPARIVIVQVYLMFQRCDLREQKVQELVVRHRLANFIFHALIIAHFPLKVKGANRPKRYG